MNFKELEPTKRKLKHFRKNRDRERNELEFFM